MTRRLPDPGSSEWIGRAYDAYAAGLYRYALMLLRDPSAASDVVQQVFVSLMRQRRAIDALDRYLRRAVRNECFSVARRQVHSRLEPAMLEPVDPAGDDPEQRAVIAQALDALPIEQRETVHLKVFEGMTFQEIADLSGESINTIASRYRYAMDKLRTMLGVRS
jgi:RNA polymerase sigma-70 factor (ECF subfamily)